MKNRKLWVSALAGFLALLMVMSMFSGLFMQAEAASSSELKKQLSALKGDKKELDEKIEELRSQLKENFSEMEDIVEQKDLIDQEIFYLHQQTQNLNDQIATCSLLISDKQEELDNAKKHLEILNQQNKDRIQAMEEEGSLSYWSVLFKANSFSDLLDRVNMVQEIAAADQRRMQNLKEAAEKVEAVQRELQEEKEAMEEMVVELAASEQVLEEKRAQADKLLDQLIAQGEAFEELIDDSEDKISDLEEQIAKKEKEYDAAKYREWLATSVPPTTKKPSSSNASSSSGSSSSVPNSKGWRSPLVKSSYVTSAYGMRLHPIKKVWKMHHGVDLQSRKGDKIVAAKSGVVTTTSYESGGAGNYVIINHGDGFSSAYMHMTHYIVKKGQYVNAGQVIGYVGSTGGSTGPHLHFSIYYNGKSVNPVNYVNFR